MGRMGGLHVSKLTLSPIEHIPAGNGGHGADAIDEHANEIHTDGGAIIGAQSLLIVVMTNQSRLTNMAYVVEQVYEDKQGRCNIMSGVTGAWETQPKGGVCMKFHTYHRPNRATTEVASPSSPLPPPPL